MQLGMLMSHWKVFLMDSIVMYIFHSLREKANEREKEREREGLLRN